MAGVPGPASLLPIAQSMWRMATQNFHLKELLYPISIIAALFRFVKDFLVSQILFEFPLIYFHETDNRILITRRIAWYCKAKYQSEFFPASIYSLSMTAVAGDLSSSILRVFKNI